MKYSNWKVFATLLFSTHAHAGFGAHGGNVVQCQGKPAVVLDYYHAGLPTIGEMAPELVDFSGLSAEQTTEAVVKLIRDQYFGKFADQLEENLVKIGPIKKWIQADLKQVDDANEPYLLPASCVRKTAAVRQQNVIMYGDAAVIGSLYPAQQGLLLVHEALYLLSGQETSESVRSLMRELLQRKPAREILRSAIHQVGGDATTTQLPVCGNTQSNVKERVGNCSSLPESSKNSNTDVRWNLVSRFLDEESNTYNEIWQDSNSGLVWTNPLTNFYTHTQAIQLDAAGQVLAETACQSADGDKASNGIEEKTFGIPTAEEFIEAEKNGMESIVPHYHTRLWTSSIRMINGYEAWRFQHEDGHLIMDDHRPHIRMQVRCVGR